jgi:hypothetical protein
MSALKRPPGLKAATATAIRGVRRDLLSDAENINNGNVEEHARGERDVLVALADLLDQELRARRARWGQS